MKVKIIYVVVLLVLVFSLMAAVLAPVAMAQMAPPTILAPVSSVSAEAGVDPAEGPAQPDAAAEAGIEASLTNLPLYFIENQGQVDERVAYYVQGSYMNLYFTAEDVTFAMSATGEEDGSRQQYAIKLEFVEANPDVQPIGRDRTEAVISYFKGFPEEWNTGIPTYAGVIYPDLWPGIDLVYSGDASHLKYTFLVQPGADPSQIGLAYHGASALTINEGGQMEVSAPLGGFIDDRPVSYQDICGKRVPVESNYALDEDSYSYGFELGSYDPGELLVIDPAVLVYCGYIGGASTDLGYGIAVDGSGCAYVTGWTGTNEVTFPDGDGFGTLTGPDTSFNGDDDAFVAKVNADGTGLVYCGYIGGNESDRGYGIAVDGSGCAYVTGNTYSDEITEGFPVFVGPDLTQNGGSDAFVAKVKADGSGLDYCGYIGGNDYDTGLGIAVDGSGCAYVTGYTFSGGTTFPVTVGPDLSFNDGNYDAFVAKVKADGTGLDYCGYIGGSNDDDGWGIAVDGSGCAYVTGQTDSDETTESFPVAVGPDLTQNGDRDAFVAKVKADGTGLDYCGYIGGSDDDDGYGIAVDGSGCAYVAGSAESDEITEGFPVTVGPDLSHSGYSDAFVAKVKADGTGLDYCGYIGGSSNDFGKGIAMDGSGCAYVTGGTYSSQSSFPVTVGPDTTHNGEWDVFVAKVKANPNDPTPENNFDYCGYIGGSDYDHGYGIAVDGSGCAYVTGNTKSDEITEGFPVTVGPDTTHNGYTDAFVAKVCETAVPTPTPTTTPTPTLTPTPIPETIHIDSNPFLFVYGMIGDPPGEIWTTDCDLPDALTNVDGDDCTAIIVWGVEGGVWMSYDVSIGAGYLGYYGLDAGQAYVMTHEDCVCTDWEMCE